MNRFAKFLSTLILIAAAFWILSVVFVPSIRIALAFGIFLIIMMVRTFYSEGRPESDSN